MSFLRNTQDASDIDYPYAEREMRMLSYASVAEQIK